MYLTWPIGGQVREQTQSCLALEGSRPTMHNQSNFSHKPVHHRTIRLHPEYRLQMSSMYHVCTQYILLYACNMECYGGAPQHGSKVEHDDKGRVTNPSLAGDVEITVSEYKTLYLMLVVRHRRRARMQIDFL
jgi:hypothetical protein